MSLTTDATHDPSLTSWVPSAQGSDFPIQNLPYGRLRRAGSREAWRIGVRIGDQVLDLAAARLSLNASGEVAAALDALAAGDLNAVMGSPKAIRVALRHTLSAALAAGSDQAAALVPALLDAATLEMGLPCRIGDYTDFYTGIHHATTVGKLFRPDAPLLPNYRWVPIGYHGRASSIVVSGTPVRRPMGQLKAADAAQPTRGPTQRLDHELELGVFVGPGNEAGQTVGMAEAEDRLFGMVLLNDWSARDVQAWEYQPLGPFLAKNFATSISPWVVTMEALAPFRAAFSRPAGDPAPLPYLDSEANRRAGALSLTLEAWLQTETMRARGEPPVRLSRGQFRDTAYWTLAQMLVHHASNGCNLQPGDLLGTGTQSGPNAGEAGSLLELSLGGSRPIDLPGGEQRRFLLDGDTLTLRAWAEAAGAVRIGLGECAGTILPAG